MRTALNYIKTVVTNFSYSITSRVNGMQSHSLNTQGWESRILEGSSGATSIINSICYSYSKQHVTTILQTKVESNSHNSPESPNRDNSVIYINCFLAPP